MNKAIRLAKKILTSHSFFVAMLLFFSLAFASVLVMSTSHRQEMLPGCPMAAAVDQSICSMTAVEHSTLLQTLSRATPGDHSLASLIIVFLGFVSTTLFIAWKARERLRKRRFGYSFGSPALSNIFNHFIEIFSRGILNPKKYDAQLVV